MPADFPSEIKDEFMKKTIFLKDYFLPSDKNAIIHDLTYTIDQSEFVYELKIKIYMRIPEKNPIPILTSALVLILPPSSDTIFETSLLMVSISFFVYLPSAIDLSFLASLIP